MTSPGIGFAAGGDDRRNRAGRYPTSAGLSRMILRAIGRDAPEIIERIAVLARSGDPEATVAAAILISTLIREPPT